jgi:ketosteroid isomerase-like protein
MSGDAYDTIKRFWEIQDDGDDAKLSVLFADDAVLEDPAFATFEGGHAIGARDGKLPYSRDDMNG